MNKIKKFFKKGLKGKKMEKESIEDILMVIATGLLSSGLTILIYFYVGGLDISFVPWVLLSFLSFGVGLFLYLKIFFEWKIFNFHKTQSFSISPKQPPQKPFNPWTTAPKVQVEKEEEKEIPPIWGNRVLAGGH